MNRCPYSGRELFHAMTPLSGIDRSREILRVDSKKTSYRDGNLGKEPVLWL